MMRRERDAAFLTRSLADFYAGSFGFIRKVQDEKKEPPRESLRGEE